MWKVCGEVKFKQENLKERNNLVDVGVDGWIILKWIFNNYCGVWTGLMRLRKGKGGVLL